MYSQIASNRRKSLILIVLFVGLLAAAGYAYGYYTGSGYEGVMIALVVSVGWTLISWFAGDKIVLATTGAQQITGREQNPYLWNLVENLCITAGLPMPKLYLVDDPSPNAFATGRDPAHASIAVTSGIVPLLQNEELEGVIAHELSHIKNYDTRWMLLVAVLVGALSLIANWFTRGSLFRRRGRDNDGGIGLIIGLLLLVLSPIIGELIKLAISRQREYLADASGALLTRYPEGLANALEKIRDTARPLARAPEASAHLWISDPQAKESVGSKIASLFSTHPPIKERIRLLREMGR